MVIFETLNALAVCADLTYKLHVQGGPKKTKKTARTRIAGRPISHDIADPQKHIFSISPNVG